MARALAPAYEIEAELGRGGAGIVYRAKDLRLKRSVAVKILPPDLAFRPDVRDRFMREAETSAHLTHPHIVPIFSVDEKEGLAFFMAEVASVTQEARALSKEIGYVLAAADELRDIDGRP